MLQRYPEKHAVFLSFFSWVAWMTAAGSAFWGRMATAQDMKASQEEDAEDSVHDCEGEDLKGQSCRTLGFTGGVLRCNAHYEFDFSGCTKCGNRVVEPGEDCEPSRPLSSTCEQQGFPGGTLQCRADCTFDVSNCSKWLKLEAGRRHACAQASDGRLWCWGDNGSGQLGTVSNPPGPAPVAKLGTDVKLFTAGSEHTCAVRGDGSVWCWGSNTADGRLGDGTTALRRAPVRVAVLAGGVKSIAAGEMHTCALLQDGSVWCWGNNSMGQIGDGTRKDRYAPVRVEALGTGVRELAVGALHACALRKDDTLWCWGDNASGQLGEEPSSAKLSPVRVSGIITRDAVALTAGVHHTCLLDKKGRAFCWGGVKTPESTGQETVSPMKALQLEIDAPTGRWAQLSVGNRFGCGRTTAGLVYCWGEGRLGQLGSGRLTDEPSPVQVISLSGDVVDVKAGENFACALSRQGSISCWGDNASGQVGILPAAHREKPVLVRSAASFSRVFAGFDRTCALDVRQNAWCWGDNMAGQLGDGTSTARELPVMVPLSGVREVALGALHTCFLTADGRIFCTGDNAEGQLGTGGEDSRRFSPRHAVEFGENAARSVCAGRSHACALLENGAVRCWGRNAEGQLGTGGTKPRWMPVAASIEGSVSGLACGEAHTCILKSNGQVWCWGDNTYGQLGDGSRDGRTLPVRVMLPFSPSFLAAGARHTCAGLENGAIWCWGFNFYGQLGDGTTEDRAAPGKTLPGLSIRSIAVGTSHGCAVRADGTVACWGKNDHGQLGDGTLTLRKSPVAAALAGFGKVREVSTGVSHTCALLSDGRIACWGAVRMGQLGDGAIGFFSVPRRLSASVVER